MKKKLILSLLLISLLLLLPFSASAEEEGAEITQEESIEAASGTEESEENKESEEFEETVSQTLAAFIERNADGILSGLTLISSLLVAFLYKAGLLPLLRNGISAISDTAGKTGKMAEEFTEQATEALTSLRESTAPAAEAVKKTEEYLATLTKALADAKITQEETKEILAAETTLFYELLCSVNLPEEQKDSMRNSYYRLREKLEGRQ